MYHTYIFIHASVYMGGDVVVGERGESVVGRYLQALHEQGQATTGAVAAPRTHTHTCTHMHTQREIE